MQFYLLILTGLLISMSTNRLIGQHTDLVDSSQVQVLADTSKSYFLPDISQKDLRWTKGGNKLFTHKMVGDAANLPHQVRVQWIY